MKNPTMKRLAVVAAVALALLLAACSGPDAVITRASQQEVPVTETGSTLMVPLMAAWGFGYQQAYSQASLTPGGSDSGTGVAWAGLGKASIGASDAYLSPLQHLEFPSLVNIPLAVAALDVNYNVPGVRHLRLNGPVLAQIYTGKITSWNDKQIASLNPGVSLPAKHITVVRRSDSSGSSFLFTSYLHAQDPAGWPAASTTPSWPKVPGELAEHGSSNVLLACQHTRGCVAYIGVSYQPEINLAGLGTATLANGSGAFVRPTTASIARALKEFSVSTPVTGTQSLIGARNGYPIINYEYAMVQRHQQSTGLAKSIRQFLTWGLTKGSSARYLSGVGFVPLPLNVRTIAQNLVSQIR